MEVEDFIVLCRFFQKISVEEMKVPRLMNENALKDMM